MDSGNFVVIEARGIGCPANNGCHYAVPYRALTLKRKRLVIPKGVMA